MQIKAKTNKKQKQRDKYFQFFFKNKASFAYSSVRTETTNSGLKQTGFSR